MTASLDTAILTDKIEHLRLENSERLTARVAKKELWIELEGGAMAIDPAIWASFCLVPAMEQEMDILMKGVHPPDGRWMGNFGKLTGIFHDWWGGRIPQVAANGQPPWRQQLRLLRPAAGRALFFSGGVDSFHALLLLIQRGTPPHALIFVEGFDFDHRDTGRIESYLPAVRKICAHHKMKLLRVRTNLRRLPFFRESHWARTHGLAMAGVAHSLRDYGHIYIASSFQERGLQYYGSRWDVDPCFSSATHRFYHVGEDAGRHQKIALLAPDPLVREHLRVCWQEGTGRLNCGICEKCLRTELSLHLLGVTDRFSGFANEDSLEDRLGRINPDVEAVVEIWLVIRGQDLSSPMASALRSLFLRVFERGEPLSWDFRGSESVFAAMAEFCGFRKPFIYFKVSSAEMHSRTKAGPE